MCVSVWVGVSVCVCVWVGVSEWPSLEATEVLCNCVECNLLPNV